MTSEELSRYGKSDETASVRCPVMGSVAQPGLCAAISGGNGTDGDIYCSGCGEPTADLLQQLAASVMSRTTEEDEDDDE